MATRDIPSKVSLSANYTFKWSGAVVLILPTIYAMTGGLLLQWLLGYNFSVAVWVGCIALFGIAVETGVVMVVYLHEALERRLLQDTILNNTDIEAA